MCRRGAGRLSYRWRLSAIVRPGVPTRGVRPRPLHRGADEKLRRRSDVHGRFVRRRNLSTRGKRHPLLRGTRRTMWTGHVHPRIGMRRCSRRLPVSRSRVRRRPLFSGQPDVRLHRDVLFRRVLIAANQHLRFGVWQRRSGVRVFPRFPVGQAEQMGMDKWPLYGRNAYRLDNVRWRRAVRHLEGFRLGTCHGGLRRSDRNDRHHQRRLDTDRNTRVCRLQDFAKNKNWRLHRHARTLSLYRHSSAIDNDMDDHHRRVVWRSRLRRRSRRRVHDRPAASFVFELFRRAQFVGIPPRTFVVEHAGKPELVHGI